MWNYDIISILHIWNHVLISWCMKSYYWNHMHGIWYHKTIIYDFRYVWYHTCIYNIWNHIITWNYYIHISYMQSCHDFMIYDIISLKSYAWDMISRNHHIWFQVTYDIIVSSMKSYPWNHQDSDSQLEAYDVMQSCLWNHGDAYNIIDLWHHKTIDSWVWYHNKIIPRMISYPWNMKS